jgi:tRNA (cytosine38-C5)-methyltransferase
LEDAGATEIVRSAFYDRFKVPDTVLVKSGMSFDLVFADSSRSCCFTKNYGRLVEGTGSVLQTASPNIKGIPGQPESLKELRLRYLSPREIARLHGFPEDCSLAQVSDKQAYALLGNSLNVTLVTELLAYLWSWESNEAR